MSRPKRYPWHHYFYNKVLLSSTVRILKFMKVLSGITGKNNRFPFLDILGYLKNTHKKSQIWKSETSPNQGTWLGIPLLGFVSFCQIWDFCGYSLNTLKYPVLGICYFFLWYNVRKTVNPILVTLRLLKLLFDLFELDILLIKTQSRLESPGVLPKMAFRERLHPKGIPFSGFKCMRGLKYMKE